MKQTRLLVATLAAFALGSSARADTFDFTGSETTFTAPATGLYDILAFRSAGRGR